MDDDALATLSLEEDVLSSILEEVDLGRGRLTPVFDLWALFVLLVVVEGSVNFCVLSLLFEGRAAVLFFGLKNEVIIVYTVNRFRFSCRK